MTTTTALPPEVDYLTADAGPNYTAVRVVEDLGAKAAALEQFPGLAAWPARTAEWSVVVVPTLGRRWVLRWDRLTVAVPAHGDLLLAKALVEARIAARRRLRTLVINTALELGLGRTRFLYPAPTRCPECLTNGYGPTHVPGSADCRETRRERDYQRGQ